MSCAVGLPPKTVFEHPLEMNVWEWSAGIGVAFGLGAFALIFFPIVAIQYRRYGRFTALRLLGAAAVSVYITTLIAYTLLPLPSSTAAVCAPKLQLVPFHFVADIATESAGKGLPTLVLGPATLQVVFNVALFVPLGIIARGFFSRSLPVTVGIGFATSLFIEATQYTGLWGIYSCPYRLADVDDVMTNALGALAGALLAPVALAWMPSGQQFRATRGDARPVTVWRRWLGMAIDFALFSIVGPVLVTGYRIILLAITGHVAPAPNVVEAVLGSLLPAVLIFILPALRHSGATIGQTAVWLVPSWPKPASATRRILRAASVGGLYGVLLFASQLPQNTTLAGTAATLLAIAAVISVPLTRGAAGLSGLVAGCTMRDERTPAPSSAGPSDAITVNAETPSRRRAFRVRRGRADRI
jgi:glycopeptide antibiotics resistance protein